MGHRFYEVPRHLSIRHIIPRPQTEVCPRGWREDQGENHILLEMVPEAQGELDIRRIFKA